MTLENRNDEMEALLSAYAFGELEGDELAEMAARVEADPLLAMRVAELRAFGDELGAALKGEPLAAAAVNPPEAAERPASPAVAAPPRGRVLPFPVWAWTAAGFAAAAGLAVMVSWRAAELPAGEREIGRAPVPPVSPPPPVQVQAPPSPVEPAGAERATGDAPAPAVAAVELPVSAAFSGAFEVQFPPLASAPVPPPPAGGGMKIHFDGSGSSSPAFGGAPAPTVVLGPPPAAPATRVAAAVSTAGLVGGVETAAYHPKDRQDFSVGSAEGTRARINRDAFAGVSSGTLFLSQPTLAPTDTDIGAEAYVGVRESGFVAVESSPLSTFSIDVDTASYANVRRFIQDGRRPPRDAVRVEELINYFPYRYAPPVAGTEAPFAAHLAASSAPWAPAHRLVRVAIKGRELSVETRPAANLVFLVDVSGSMSSANKLPLVKASLRQLLGQLRADDRVAIVTYAGASGLALPSTPASQGGEILDALDRLESGGSTNGGMGIHLAYDIAKANFRPEGVNRVILCTDGDFNVGVTGRQELLSLIQEKARSRVYLTVLGFGMGNLKDGTLEMLADKGNGAYGYIDSAREARKIFVEQVQGTLATIAKDVKIQVEFNPARVASYRLIGYENRALAKEDFNNDQVDAGEVGAGHTVTALYEIVPVGVPAAGESEPRPEVDPLKYGPKKKPAPVRRAPVATSEGAGADELLTVKIRYKAPDADVSRKLEFPLVDRGAEFAASDAEFKFAAAVAAWGMLLRESPHAGSATYADVLRWAEDGLAADAGGHRAEFVELVGRAQGGEDE